MVSSTPIDAADLAELDTLTHLVNLGAGDNALTTLSTRVGNLSCRSQAARSARLVHVLARALGAQEGGEALRRRLAGVAFGERRLTTPRFDVAIAARVAVKRGVAQIAHMARRATDVRVTCLGHRQAAVTVLALSREVRHPPEARLACRDERHASILRPTVALGAAILSVAGGTKTGSLARAKALRVLRAAKAFDAEGLAGLPLTGARFASAEDASVDQAAM